MKKHSLIFIVLVIIFISNNYCKNTDKKMSNLHNKISKDLLSLKKNHPHTQPQVYSLLDQVCKMYQLSKTTMKKKKELKVKLIHVNKNRNTLENKNTVLTKEINILKVKFYSKIKILESKNKILAKNTAILGFVNKEKLKMEKEINRLKEEQKQLILKTQDINTNNNQNFNIVHNDNTTEKKVLDQLQSINLTST